MRPTQFSAAPLATFLRKQKIATMPELKEALGTQGRRTVFRKLEELKYRSSYTHRGRFYTLEEVADFDDDGLWSWDDVWFSIHGTLLATAARFVQESDLGYFVGELDNALRVGTKDALRKLAQDGRVTREFVDGRYLYCAADSVLRRAQLWGRRTQLAEPGVAGPIPEPEILPDELRAAIVLFYSLLDERQRRLYAGLEALKTGHGGDSRIARFFGLDRGTVARGRQELLKQEIESDRVRKVGGGRQAVEKNARCSRSNH